VHHRRIVCEHRIEVEVYPASAEVYFADERFADPALSQVRFHAAVINAPSAGVVWTVRSIGGGAAVGHIDATGLYTASNKSGISSGTTEIVQAASADDPTRTATAFVTLVGDGPEDPPVKRILLSPHRSSLYRPTGFDNQYIDPGNKIQVFRAIVEHSDDEVEWLVDGTVKFSGSHLFCYSAPDGGGSSTVRITARLKGDHDVSDESIISIGNYIWPGLH
jgi:hypothetical protein